MRRQLGFLFLFCFFSSSQLCVVVNFNMKCCFLLRLTYLWPCAQHIYLQQQKTSKGIYYVIHEKYPTVINIVNVYIISVQHSKYSAVF